MKHLLLSSVVFVAACSSASGRDGHGGGSTGGGGGSNAGGGGSAGGSNGGGSGTGGGSNGGGGGTSSDCSGAAKLIYVVDQDGTLYSFTPNQTDISQSVFGTIGTVKCPGQSGGIGTTTTPFSMAVDREANAWIEYQTTSIVGTATGDNTLFKVSTKDASCTATSYKGGQSGFSQFGMGYASNSAMSSDETLYIMGGASIDGSNTSLGSLDTSSMAVASIKTGLTGSPELTGTGLGDLWGFFPDLASLGGTSTTPYIAQLGKMDGSQTGNIMLPTLPSGASAWAFAFYGGDFYIFLGVNSGNTVVYQVSNSALKTASLKTNKHIVGAGVSTCAPVIPIS